jgi:hypothetical protein
VRATSCFPTIHPCVTHAKTLSKIIDTSLKFLDELVRSMVVGSVSCLESVSLSQEMDVKSQTGVLTTPTLTLLYGLFTPTKTTTCVSLADSHRCMVVPASSNAKLSHISMEMHQRWYEPLLGST